jgi:hypothetical protein
MKRRCRSLLILLVALCIVGPTSADAQTTRQPPKPATKTPAKPKVKKDPKWTFEVFGGGGFGGSAGGDASSEFPAGTSFTTESGFPSRVVPSWYFGDGAVLFDQVRAQFASLFNITVPELVSLDPVFADGALERNAGATFGVRLMRKLTPRYALEFGLQRSQGKLALSDSAQTAVEASRASFDQAFRGLLGTIPQTGLQVSSTAEIPDSATAPQTAITAVLNIALSPGKRPLAPYVSVGVGRLTNGAETLRVRLRGSYQFRFFDSNPFNETDSVTIRTSDRESSFVGVFGGGAMYELSPRQGLRFDLRIHIGNSGIATELDASPTVVTATPVLALPSNTNPSIQFSNTNTLKSSLSGRISDQTVVAAGGMDTRLNLTVGYFFRF